MNNTLDIKFHHSIWYKGENMTMREFLQRAANNYGAFGIKKSPSRHQSDRLLDPIRYEVILFGAERGSLKLTAEQYEYYRILYNENIKKLFNEQDIINCNLLLKEI